MSQARIQTPNASAQERVARCRDIVYRQRQYIAEIRAKGADADRDERLLRTFERSLAIFENDLVPWSQAS